MSVGTLFTRELWEQVARGLEGAAERWWNEHRDDVTGIALDELEDIARALRRGDTVEAKMSIAARMTRAEWVAYRDGTTKTLQGIAATRARLLEALEDLGMRTARVVGKAIVAALGL